MSRLTAAERNALPDSAFADPKHRAYPMQDAGHRQAALGLVSRYGTSEQKREVHARAAHAGSSDGKARPHYLPTHSRSSHRYGGDPLEEGQGREDD